MVRLILGVICAFIGAAIGYYFDHPWFGAFVGFLFGLIGPAALDAVD